MKITLGVRFEIEDRGPVIGWLEYDDADPWAVRAHFHCGQPHSAHWDFARELLDGPMFETVGDGDVKVTTCDQWVYLALSSPDGAVTLRAAHRDITVFLSSTYSLVPRGSEKCDIDVSAFLDGPV